jgi:DNA-binding MarR family transcriptional regulator
VDSEDILFPVLIKRCSRLVDKRIDLLLKEHGIARSQYRVLYYVAKRGILSQKELLDILEIQGSTLTLIVNALVHKQWLVRMPDDNDGRIKKLRLTPAGQERFKTIPNPVEAINRLLASQLIKQESDAVEALIRKIITQLA